MVVDSRICIQPPASDWSHRCPFPRWEQDESIQNPLLSNFLPNPAPTRGPRFCMVNPTANFPPGRPENHKLEAKRLTLTRGAGPWAYNSTDGAQKYTEGKKPLARG